MEAAFSKNTPKESPYFSSSSSGSGSVKSKSSTVKEDPFFTDIDTSKKLTSSVFNSKSSNTNNSGYKEDPFFMETLFPSANTKKAVKKLGKKENVVIKPAQQSIDQLLVNSHKRFQLDENIREANKAMEFMAKLKANSQKPIDITDMTLEEKEEDDQEDMQKHIEENKDCVKKMMTFIGKLNIKKEIPKPTEIELSDDSRQKAATGSSGAAVSLPKRKFDIDSSEDEESEQAATSTIDEMSDVEVIEDEAASDSKPSKPKRKFDYEAIDEDTQLNEEIDAIQTINLLTENQIHYMVLRDINYFIDIYSGHCEHSWRHLEFKKQSKKSGNVLYSHAALTSYTLDQYTSAVKALQEIFCKKDNKADEYIVKVLLPEALIKICMRIYQCSKEAAEEYLQKNNFKNNFKEVPKGCISK